MIGSTVAEQPPFRFSLGLLTAWRQTTLLGASITVPSDLSTLPP